MGFQAYLNEEADRAVDFSDNAKEIDSATGVTPNAKNYYLAIIKKALNIDPGTKFENLGQNEYDELTTHGNQKFIPYLEEFWINENGIEKLSIAKNTLGNPKFNELLDLITNTENGFRWKYLNGNKTFKDKKEKEVLDELSIVNTSTLNKIFFADYSANSRSRNRESSHLWNINKKGKPGYDTSPPTVYPPFIISDKTNSAEYTFYIHTKSVLLFLDANKETKKYYYSNDSTSVPVTGKHNGSKALTYYYFNNNGLNGYCSDVAINENKLCSGYEGRSDASYEIDYRWCFEDGVQGEDLNLAKLSAFLMELDFSKRIETPLNVPNGFMETNWPRSYNELKEQPNNQKRWFRFYKKFLDKGRRNNPRTEIQHPWIIRSNTPKSNSFEIDIQSKKYRVWKKKNQLGSEEGKRENAASIMARALQNTVIYENLKNIKFGESEPNKSEINNSSLPATSFAQGVLNQDHKARNRWNIRKIKKDEVRTNQEWCHLLGHGDGGTEELGNFVGGSKHCNTEQLAIETGQRRLTQNEKLKPKPEIKGSITAYLMPNEGTARKGPFKKTEVDKILDLKASKEFSNFFEEDSSNATNYRLKDDFKSSFEALSNKIANNDDAIEKQQLFRFRCALEKHFFIYLPLALTMRYKHYYNNTKVFDHIYDAQSESNSIFECKILDYTVRATLYNSVEKWNDYKEKIVTNAKEKLPETDELKQITEVLRINALIDDEIMRLDFYIKHYTNDYASMFIDDFRKIPEEFDKLNTSFGKLRSSKFLKADDLKKLEKKVERLSPEIENLKDCSKLELDEIKDQKLKNKEVLESLKQKADSSPLKKGQIQFSDLEHILHINETAENIQINVVS